jgi:hypothetical protein
MPDIDFTGVRSDVRAAFQYDFTQVRKLAARRTRRTRLRAGAAVAVIAVAAVAGLRWLPASGTGDPQPPAAPPPSVGSSSDVPYHHAVVPFPATAASVDRLYLPYYDCLGDACGARVAVSGDGGRSWSKVDPTGLPEPVTLLGIVPLGPLDAVLRVTDGTSTIIDLVTDDGGQTWRPVTAGPPISSIPTAGHLIWDADNSITPSDRTGRALVVDPRTGTARPLTNQPSIAHGKLTVPDRSADSWVGGADVAGLAAVAVSHDAGGTWVTHSFPAPGNAIVAAAGTSTSYVVVNPAEPGPAASDWGAFRSLFIDTPARPAIWITRDGGVNWETVSATPPAGEVTGAAVLPDGSLLLRVQAHDGSVANYRSMDNGRSFAATQGGPGVSITVMGPNAYLASDLPADSTAITGVDPHQAYLSTDDQHWTTVSYPQLP